MEPGFLMKLRAAEVFRYELPLASPLPLRGAGLSAARSGWIVALHADDPPGRNADGVVGFGEVAPLDLGADAMARTESELLDRVEQLGASNAGDQTGDEGTACVTFGITSALDALRAEASGVPIHRWYSNEASAIVKVNALAPLYTTDYAIRDLLYAGYRSVKVKVGLGAVADEAREVRRMSELLVGASLRLDANRAWSMAEACDFADRISDIPIDYIEEPLEEADRLGELYNRTNWPIALDESLRETQGETGDYRCGSPQDLIRSESRFLNAVVLKPTTLGDPRQTMVLASVARDNGLRAVVSSSLESGIGLRALAAIASHPQLSGEPAGLSTHSLYRRDTCRPGVRFGSMVDVDELLGHQISLADGLVSLKKFA
jgi:O-succinylbenzoate synthase